ncbi:KAP family P-loop NTPase fold protein [Empedobacter brevis]|uniref:KAP family P-loop NTPase fold protein n=1 Tax=Empedobacter brevis TaxID=247 RepID=UPI000370F04A|nr:P-loop NTPase fold protein [Empedobacter brevis]
MNILSKVKYFDFFLLLAIVPIILIVSFWYFNRVKEKENKKSDFYDDNPINCSEEDILNRKQKAIQVARLIKGNKSKTSLAIGIVGEWGNGKTSFMNFIEESFVDEKDYIIVHFNSWLNISINSIINDFFNTIEKKISIYSIDISKELKKYGNNVLSINKNSTTETLLNAINIIPENSLSDNFENLNTLLNKLDKKVIVFFDDIDRLQPNEVFEVLKLIRNTASFDVFSFVVGYDKAYLNIALEKNNISFSDRYYEKIFKKNSFITN